MTMILTYDDVFSRVRISVTGLDASTDEVLIERSTNQINWTTVRGGTALTPTANAVQLDDYEFSANVLNYYRATAIDTAASTFVAAGAAATGNNTSLVPAMPAGLQSGDLVLVLASIRNSGTGVPDQPAGWSTVMDASNMKMFAKIVTGAEPAPTITFTGGVAGADTLARTAAFRRTSLTVGNVATRLNPSAQNVTTPSLVVPDDRMVFIYATWKQDDFSAMADGPAGEFFTGMGLAASTAGDDAGQYWAFRVYEEKKNLDSSELLVIGGAAAISRVGAIVFEHEDFTLSTETSSITPTIDETWLKSITRPFLNRTLDCVPNQSPITRRARNGVFPVVGRTFPIAVTDVRLARELTIEVITQTEQQWEEFDLVMASGDIFFIQTPPGDPLPTMYVVIGDTSMRRPLRNRDCGNDWRVFTLPLTEVAAPGADVVGALGTYQTVVNTYATYADVLAAHATYADLLTLVGGVSEVIVS